MLLAKGDRRLLVDFRDTSAGTAQAARMGAILQAEYAKLWPETIRALLIHSAEWTERLRAAFGSTKNDAVSRLCRYGYGVPSLARALYSARSSLTLIAQKAIRPFTKEGSDIKTNDMGLHSLPWPKEQLLDLGDQPVTMRVTLSYFIEPKPGRREGFATSRHRYQSYGLRFGVKRPQETVEDLKKRVSSAAREEEETYVPVGDTAGWALGPQIRTRASVHSDWWTGTAADLANCGFIAVYPVSGWWRESKGNHWSKEARYALVVTIRTETTRVSLFAPLQSEIDLYTPVDTVTKAGHPADGPHRVGNRGRSFRATVSDMTGVFRRSRSMVPPRSSAAPSRTRTPPDARPHCACKTAGFPCRRTRTVASGRF
jgi:hypothetical protein